MPSGRDRRLATHYVSRGKQFVLEGQYREALEPLQEAVRLDPTSTNAWITLALTHYQVREYGECLGAVDEALKHEVSNGKMWNYRGLALFGLGHPAEAYRSFSHAAATNDKEPLYPSNACAALSELRRYDLALIWAERSLALISVSWPTPYWGAATNYAIGSIYLGRHDEAEAQLARVATLASGQSAFWAAIGLLYLRRGQHDNALVAIKRAIELDHDEPFAWECMAELLVALEDYTKALEVAIHGLEIRPHNYDLLELKAKALRGLGRESEAVEIESAMQSRLTEQLALLDQADSANG